MSDLIGSLKAFTVVEIEKSSLPLPVTVQLMDISSVPFVEVVATGKDPLGIYSWEQRPIPGTLGFSVRVTSVARLLFELRSAYRG